ncbi:MFS transporter [Paenibacillus sp. FSL H7-0331]|nr:MFS transporter [Paenibacillus sp. FSL H7-0331]
MSEASSVNVRSFGVIKGFNFFIYGAIAIYSSFFPLYLKAIGMSNFMIGLLLAGGPFISLLSNPFWGYWSDRLQNGRRILILLLVGNGLVMQAVFAVHSTYFIYGLMLIYFFFQTPLFSQSNSLILDVVERTGHKFGSFRLWGALGWAIMAVVTGPILEWLGIGEFWIVYGLMIGISIVLGCMLPRQVPTVSAKKISAGGYGKILGNKLFLSLIIIGILISIPNSMNNIFVSIYISDMGGSNALIGWSAFLSSIFEIPVYLLLDRYLRRNNKTMIACLIVVSLLYALRWLLMSMAVTPYQIIFTQTLHCLTFAGYYYVGTQLTAYLIPQQFRASGQAVYALSWGGLAGIIAGIIGGWMFQDLGAPTMYRICTLMALLGAAGFATMYMYAFKSTTHHHT